MGSINCFLSLCVNFCLLVATAHPTSGSGTTHGHLKPLGLQTLKQGPIDQMEGFPDPDLFYKKYVHSSKPVLFKGAAHNIPAFSKWSDEYLEKHYGKIIVDVEIGKKEDRKQRVERMPLTQFLHAYTTEEIYLVQDVVNVLKDDLTVPRCLQCGGFQHVLEAAVMWFSSGGTTSVLHYDAVDNINCLFDGNKTLIMIDKDYWQEVESAGFEHTEGYSRVDVEKVDLDAYPQFSAIAWWSADMQAGDCLFIPYRWYHTVHSSVGRNLAVNLWFVHRMWFNVSDCDQHVLEDNASMKQYSVLGLDNDQSVEKTRQDVFGEFDGQDTISLDDVLSFWPDESKEENIAAFNLIDQNKDAVLNWQEVYTSDIMYIIQRYPFIVPDMVNMEEHEKEEL